MATKNIEQISVTIDCRQGIAFPRIDKDELNSVLQQYGQMGWEIVSSCPITDGRGATHQMILLFKRES